MSFDEINNQKFVKKLKGKKFSQPIIDFFNGSEPKEPLKGSFSPPKKTNVKFSMPSIPSAKPYSSPVINKPNFAKPDFAKPDFAKPSFSQTTVHAIPQIPQIPLKSSWHHHEEKCIVDDETCEKSCDSKDSCNSKDSKSSKIDIPHLDNCWGIGGSGYITTDVTGAINPSGGDSGALFNIIKSPVAVQNDGLIILGCSWQVGNVGSNNTRNVSVLRYKSNGTALDTSFGTNGIFSYSFPGSGTTPLGNSCVTGLQIDSSGKILVCGFVVGVYNNPYLLPSGFVIRLNSNGTLDSSFGSGGVVTLSLGSSVNTTVGFGSGVRFAIFTGMRIQSNGSIVCTGTSAYFGASGSLPFYFIQNGTAYNPRSVLLARYTTNGVLDTSFGTSSTGVVETTYNTNFSYSDLAGCDLYNDDSIVLGGYQADLSNDPNSMDTMFAKFTKNGSIDTSFNNSTTYGILAVQGVVVYPIPTGQTLTKGAPTLDVCNSLVTDCNNKIIGAGIAVTPSVSIESAVITGSEDFSIVRLNPDGSLDKSFNGVGYNLVELSTGLDGAYSVDVDHCGNVDAVGYSIEPMTNFRKTSLCKLNSFGSIITTVSTNSYLSSGDNYAVGCAAVDKDKLIVGITARNNTTNNLNAGVAKFIM
jgi:uncharacterized delta-60 repeat protein